MTEHDSTTELAQDKVVSLMRDDRFCMLTAVGDRGRLHSHPMTPQEVTDDGDVWFFIDSTSDQAANITAEKRVNLAFSDGSTWLSVAGHGTVRQDRAKADELWNPTVEAWFPEGKDSPNVALLHVEADSAEYWDSPGGRIASALAFAKSKVTGEKPDVGESGSVDL
jgi:general stress protein 26